MSESTERVPTYRLVLVPVGLLLVVGAPLIVTLALGRDAYVLRDYPGALVGIVTAILRGAADGAGVVTAGAIVSAMFFQRLRSNRSLHLTDSFEVTVLRRASRWWFMLAVLLVVFDGVDSVGVSPRVLLDFASLIDLVTPISYARAWMVVAVCSAVIYICTWFMSAWWHLVVPLAAVLLGNLAPVLVGSVLVGPNHDVAGDAAIVLTCLTAALGGSTVVLFLRQARGRENSSVALHRWARLGSVGVPAMICAELVVVWFKLAGTSPVGSLTGALSIARLTCLVILGAAVLATRRAESRGTIDGRWLSLGAFAVLAGVGAETAMTRFLSPQFLVETSISQVYLGFDLPDPPSFVTLTTDWRPNLLFMVLAGTAAVAYAGGFARLRGRGDAWPVARAIAFFAGCALLVVSTSSGVGRYAGADFAVHMGMHMALNMLAPILLVLGGPVTLALTSLRPSRPPGPREWVAAAIDAPFARAIYHPVLVLVVFVGSYYVLYLTPLFELMSRDHWAHQLMNLHFVVIGFMYYGLIIGVDRTPYRLPHVARLGYVFAAMPFHAFFGVVVMSSSTVIAGDFYTHLDPSWADDLLATQHIGGGIAWAGGEIPLVIVVIVLIAQWRASDEREARRKDRHLDTGRDDEFDTYNRMLRQLAERDDRAPRHVTEMTHDDS